MKLPYGLSNFVEIRTEGYFYVDKTRYIGLLEAAPEKYPVMLRPRRFGKTLFCNMLGRCYDRLHADRFEDVFGNSYIHGNPTPRCHAYMMHTFNFSGINTETLENASVVDPGRSAGYFLELKYAKAKTTNKALDKKEREAKVAMQKHLDTETARKIGNLHAYMLVFRKDVCVRRNRLQ